MDDSQLDRYRDRLAYFEKASLSDPGLQEEIAQEQRSRVFEPYYGKVIPAELWEDVVREYQLVGFYRRPENLGEAADWILESPRFSTPKPVVFISASHADSDWRERLKVALAEHNTEIEWWDDSQIAAGSDSAAEIEAAITRARIAVVLLSPTYLDSQPATTELTRLGRQAASAALRLFPILVHPCSWSSVLELRDIEVWSMAMPLGLLPAESARAELENIAKGIAELARRPRAAKLESTKPLDRRAALPPQLKFSKDAQAVLNQAQALASRSGRAGMTSSCLLFALAELAGPEDNTARFVRNSLDRAGGYATAFGTFLTDSGSAVRQSDSEVPGWEGKISKNLAAILDRAAIMASRVSHGSREVFPRHLFASLLVTPEVETQLFARNRLKRLEIDLDQLAHEFLAFIRIHANSEDQAGWAAILTPKGFLPGPAGYTSEFCGVGGLRPVEDHLGVKGWASQLAELIALRETKLPLAIGLFGNWGSGKSHFMNLIDRRLKSLMEDEKHRADAPAGQWCREIVPIYFNAWHYLDANLWASLVAQIFESLFAHLRPKEKDLQKVQELLERASGATARAAEEVTMAQAATEQAREELRVASESRRREETVIDGLLHGLSSLLPEVRPERLRQQAVELLGVQKEVASLDDLRTVVEEARSLGGRIRTLRNILWKQPGRGWRLGWLVIVVLVVPMVAYVVATQLPLVGDSLHGLRRRIAAMLAFIPALVLWMRPLLAEAKRRVKQMEDWARQAEDAQQRASQTPAVKEAKINIAAATAKEEAARNTLAEAKARENQLKEEAANLTPERRLCRFIEQRAQSVDYRGQLGLVSLARRDFQELSDIFADSEALKERVAALQASRKPGATAEAEQLQTLSRSIDRIVLFVDDLDRCQPDKVVEILQAVHLLLAFPLFAVVVGVDQRCLRQSLRMQFKGLLTQESGSVSAANAALKSNRSADDDERPATPLDYLEKIFHVPFHLPAMDDTAFATLIDRLTEPVAAPPITEAWPSRSSEPRENGELLETPPKDTQGETALAPGVPLANDKKAAAETARDRADAAAGQSAATPAPATERLIGSVPLQGWEREALRAYHPLIRTPRGATRLLNTYRLVRASIPAAEWDAFCGGHASDGEFRVAMLLLAAAAGYPAVAREWFERLCTTAPAELFLQEDAAEIDPAWIQFKRVYDATLAHITTPLTEALFNKWVNRVERFAF